MGENADKDLKQGQDLHPALTLLRGDLSALKSCANAAEATRYLLDQHKKLQNETKGVFIRDENVHAGAQMFINATTPKELITGLSTLLLDTGKFSKEDIKNALLAEYTRTDEQSNLDPQIAEYRDCIKDLFRTEN